MRCLLIIIFDVPELRDDPGGGSGVTNYNLTGNNMTSIVESSQINLLSFISNPIISHWWVSMILSSCCHCFCSMKYLSWLYSHFFLPLSLSLHIDWHCACQQESLAKTQPALTSSTSLKFFPKITNPIFLHNRPATCQSTTVLCLLTSL